MQIKAITTCVNYSDFLAESLPLNKVHFDKLVVVTTEEDIATQKLCEYHHVEWIPADFGEEGEFCKGSGINAGLKRITENYNDDWFVHLDADIVLPPQTRPILEGLQLFPRYLYGIDRFEIKSFKKWRKHCNNPKLINEMNTYIHTEAYPVSTRFMSEPQGGFLPIGFFQMWHPYISQVWTYPESHTTAGRTDMLFAAQWPRSERHLLAEVISFHLESEEAPQGINWAGRRTRPFRKLTFKEWLSCKFPPIDEVEAPLPDYEI